MAGWYGGVAGELVAGLMVARWLGSGWLVLGAWWLVAGGCTPIHLDRRHKKRTIFCKGAVGYKVWSLGQNEELPPQFLKLTLTGQVFYFSP